MFLTCWFEIWFLLNSHFWLLSSPTVLQGILEVGLTVFFPYGRWFRIGLESRVLVDEERVWRKDREICSELRWWKTFCVIFIVRNRIPDFCCTSRLIFCFRNVFRVPPALLVCQAFIRSCSRASSSTWLCHSLQFRSGLHFVDFDPEQGTDRPLGVFFVPVTTTTPGISGPLLPLAEFTLSLSILGVSCSWYHLHRYLRASLTDWFFVRNFEKVLNLSFNVGLGTIKPPWRLNYPSSLPY